MNEQKEKEPKVYGYCVKCGDKIYVTNTLPLCSECNARMKLNKLYYERNQKLQF